MYVEKATLVAGTNVTIAADDNLKTLTISSSGSTGTGTILDFGTFTTPSGIGLDMGPIAQ